VALQEERIPSSIMAAITHEEHSITEPSGVSHFRCGCSYQYNSTAETNMWSLCTERQKMFEADPSED